MRDENELARRRLSTAISADSGDMLEQLQAENQCLLAALEEQTGRAEWNYECLTKCEEKVVQRDAEIARLRLTDEEREAIHFMLRHAAQAADHDPFPDSADYIPHHKVISAMMERLK